MGVQSCKSGQKISRGGSSPPPPPSPPLPKSYLHPWLDNAEIWLRETKLIAGHARFMINFRSLKAVRFFVELLYTGAIRKPMFARRNFRDFVFDHENFCLAKISRYMLGNKFTFSRQHDVLVQSKLRLSASCRRS